MKRLATLFFFIFCAVHIYAAEPQFNLSLNIAGFTLNGNDLSKSGYVWAENDYLTYVPLVPIALPILSAGIEKNSNHDDHFSLISTQFKLNSSLSLMGVSAGGEASISFTPLLTFSVLANLQSAWNYGSSISLIGIYDPSEKEYKKTTSLADFSYSIVGKVSAIIPAGMNMAQLSFFTTYTGFTGAENKEVWKCSQINNSVNGLKYNASLLLAHRFDSEKLKLLGVTTAVDGWYKESYFDDIYKPYNPTFATWTISPMAQWKLSKNQSFTLSAIVIRNRSFANNDFKNGEELLQNYESAKWQLKSLMFFWHISLI